MTNSMDEHYSTVLTEFNAYKASAQWQQWHERDIYGVGWSVIPLFNYPDGTATDTIEHFPRTVDIVKQHFPRHRSVGFSRIEPQCEIYPHRGNPQRVLRYHLGIDCPRGQVGLRVGTKTYRWHNGRSFIFDDHLEHSAWNHTDRERIVLIIDFEYD